MFTVKELARKSEAPAHVVRYYARIGLIQAAGKRDNGYRLFARDDAGKIRFIRKAKQLGFTLGEIRKIIAHADHGKSPCSDVRKIIRQRIAENRMRIDEMTRLQMRMERALALWDEMPDDVPDGEQVCHLIETVKGDLGSQRSR